MSAYTDITKISARLNSSELDNLLDDDGEGTQDSGLLNQIIANVSQDIDGQLANIYDVPFAAPYPAMVVSMATLLVCYELYRRRLQAGEQNVFQADYERIWRQLDAIRKGDESLDLSYPRDFPMGAVTGQPTIYSGGVFGTSTSVSSSM